MSTQTSAATPVRVPQLAVRNKAGASGGSSNASERTTSSHSSTRTTSPGRDRGISDASQRSKPSQMEANARRSGSSQGKQPQQAHSSSAGSKKKNGVLGFLTLKEPSTSALDQYAEQQKKMAASKGGRATAASLSSVSIQKLPDHVPKVNSKWDGLPEDARKKLDDKRRSQDTGSLFSTSTRHTYRSANSSSSNSSTSTRRPIGSMSSRPTSMGSTVRGGHKFTVIHPTANYDTTTPIAVHADPYGEPSTSPNGVHPALRPRALSDDSPTTMHSADSPNALRSSAISVRRTSGAIPAELAGRAIAELPGDLPAELPGDEPPQMAGDEPTAYTTTPTGGSPLTPPVHDVPHQIPRVVRHGAAVDSQGTTWYSDTDPENTSASASDTDQAVVLPKAFLHRPMMEEIAESPIEYPETPEDWPLPAAARRALEKEDREREREREASASESEPPRPYDPSSLPDPSPPPTDPLPPTPTFVIPTSIYSTQRQASNRPPSLAPSVASTIDWPLPPSHRLAMATGATPRKADVAPWERFDGRAEAAEAAAAAAASGGGMGSRSVVSAGPGAGAGAREREREGKKRFSGILGRK